MTDNQNNPAAPFDFEGLFIFELSKNHGGSVEHGVRTVREFSRVAKEEGVRAAIKLQFQNLDSYIHPEQRASDDPRMKRYFASRLAEEQFKKIVDEVHVQGLISMSTPFDEESVDMLDRLGVQVIKIASASSGDWPLLERIAVSQKPVVCSIGGLAVEEVDAVYNFFKRKNIRFALLHCVGIYPTPLDQLELHHIALMKERYPDVTIGYSTHEPSDTTSAIQVAYALGARLFEKHVIIPDEKIEGNLLYYKIRTYTATPEQIQKWIIAYKEAVMMIGAASTDSYVPGHKELEILQTMMRGVYLKRAVKKGAPVKREDVYFAIPLRDSQLSAGKWKENRVADKEYAPDDPLADA